MNAQEKTSRNLLRAEVERINLVPPPSGIVCDFCSRPEPTVCIGAESFEMVVGMAGSLGDWDACATCAKLAEEANWEAIAERCLDSTEFSLSGVLMQQPVLRAAVKAHLLELYAEFAVQMNGHMKPIAEDE